MASPLHDYSWSQAAIAVRVPSILRGIGRVSWSSLWTSGLPSSFWKGRCSVWGHWGHGGRQKETVQQRDKGSGCSSQLSRSHPPPIPPELGSLSSPLPPARFVVSTSILHELGLSSSVLSLEDMIWEARMPPLRQKHGTSVQKAGTTSSLP